MQPGIEVTWTDEYEESTDEGASLTNVCESRRDAKKGCYASGQEESKDSMIRECEEFIKKFSQRQNLSGMKHSAAKKQASTKCELPLLREESAGSQRVSGSPPSETTTPKEDEKGQCIIVQRDTKASSSLKRESKYSSPKNDRLMSLKSLVKSSRKVSKWDEDSEKADRGRFLKINDSLSCIIGRRQQEDRGEDESRFDEDQERSTQLGSSVDRSDHKEVKKVAFLSDLVDYVEPVLPRINSIESKGTQEVSDAAETELVLKSYEEFVGRLRRERRTFGEPDLSTRVKTNMLALIENIDNDAGVWLGLRSDSFEFEPEGLALVEHDGRE
eukprot:CAMPEP_0202497064 /NCGR_PEP_ID=MMETSP1361-20130828/21798_1 /ASSEMBLY_ACC=CAM_ASM_000849 /TAXON_ID=210615 /ORGANISM="Staurosira complex sp., Strain CCMP2646" /LENGTH=328 /DNA_ID=CAMNT_0049128563 /DNA_START=32 /DNA_END=1018 /DNA_ORIENTATION=+